MPHLSPLLWLSMPITMISLLIMFSVQLWYSFPTSFHMSTLSYSFTPHSWNWK